MTYFKYTWALIFCFSNDCIIHICIHSNDKRGRILNYSNQANVPIHIGLCLLMKLDTAIQKNVNNFKIGHPMVTGTQCKLATMACFRCTPIFINIYHLFHMQGLVMRWLNVVYYEQIDSYFLMIETNITFFFVML